MRITTHLVDENIVVVKGSWALGMGERFTRDTLEPMEVGDYGFAARKMAHFALSKSETIANFHLKPTPTKGPTHD
jgi:hypothetical protein